MATYNVRVIRTIEQESIIQVEAATAAAAEDAAIDVAGEEVALIAWRQNPQIDDDFDAEVIEEILTPR